MDPKAELSEEEKHFQKIRRTAKNFLPDGTIHLVHKPGFTLGRLADLKKEEVYDANGRLLWSGLEENRPYEYLSWTKVLRTHSESFTDRQMKRLQTITPEFSQTVEIPIKSHYKTKEVWRYEPKQNLFAGYRVDGDTLSGYPDRSDVLERVEPVFVDMPGWQADSTAARHRDDLPAAAQDFLALVEREVGVPVRVVGVGADRDDYVIWNEGR